MVRALKSENHPMDLPITSFLEANRDVCFRAYLDLGEERQLSPAET
jgi:hypothetical protein